MADDGGDAPARVLVVDDDDPFRRIISDRLERRGFRVVEAGNGVEAVEVLEEGPVLLALLDLRMPEMDGMTLLRTIHDGWRETRVVVVTGHATVETAIEALKLGADDYLVKPFDPRALDQAIDRGIAAGRRARERGEGPRSTRSGLDAIVGESPPMRELKETLRRAAPNEAPVLLRGESGTGKELAARAIHSLSHRAAGPFVALNSANLSEELVLDTLFGHEAGAFTGAREGRPGLLAAATGGTLFVDEIAELAPRVQAQLLRAIEDRVYRPVGGTEEAKADVRFVFATHEDLRELAAEGRFRKDLLFRLEVLEIPLPPLRERPGDVPLLARHFLEEVAERMGRRLTAEDDALEALALEPFPGNVRELRNRIERAAILTDGPTLEAETLLEGREAPTSGSPGDASEDPRVVAPPDETPTLAEVETAYIRQVLDRTDGNRTRAAEVLGIHVRTLQRKLARMEEE